jgi:hypothetical protein
MFDRQRRKVCVRRKIPGSAEREKQLAQYPEVTSPRMNDGRGWLVQPGSRHIEGGIRGETVPEQASSRCETEECQNHIP